ncbi:oxidoreductase [Methylophilus flavus]|uniref:Oxidoreductase n=1 Tax=Methylophilus flavus TaxID=640084 RepID=A0ABW3PIN8_9PROT
MSEKVVIITGASSGIGLATAKLFTEKGYKVYGFSRTKVADVPFTQIITDVNDQSSVDSAIEVVVEVSGRIDILFNNAGISLLGAAEESSMEQIKSVFETNFFGAVRLTNAVLPIMRSQGAGRIIHTSSVAGVVTGPFMAYYAASKYALEAYSESLDHEVRKLGIRSVLIEPGFMKTSLGKHSTKADRLQPVYTPARKRVERIVETSLSRAPEPVVVANRVFSVSNTRCPKVRYTVGADAKILTNLKRLLPDTFFDSFLRSAYQMNSK